MVSLSVVILAARQGRSAIIPGARWKSLPATVSYSANMSPCQSTPPAPASFPLHHALCHPNYRRARDHSFAILASATSLALLTIKKSSDAIAHCEAANIETDSDLAVENEDNEDNVSAMKAVDDSPSLKSILYSGDVEAEEDEDDDPSNDEETSCSICLINRQGPCRRKWLKFERCMKEHAVEKEKPKQANQKTGNEGNNESADSKTTTMEAAWDKFMEKSTSPGEDDDGEEEQNEEVEEQDFQDGNDDNKVNMQSETSLGERCDKFMIPWISCIQQYRNVYSLISNAFYQKDYIDPLEDSIPDSNRMSFSDAMIENPNEYIIKFVGAEVDLGNWREHVEADADELDNDVLDHENQKTSPNDIQELHLINAFATFKLIEPNSSNPIEVAYIKDQDGRLLGFDSFAKRDGAGHSDESFSDDHELVHDGSTIEHQKIHDGVCTFHIIPGETTSVAAYAIYRRVKVDDDCVRSDILYQTPLIPLPLVQSKLEGTHI